MARAVRATRIAISPRFAISTRRNMRLRRSERDVAVLLRRSRLAFRAQHGERIDDPRSCFSRLDHVVEVPHPGRDVRVREAVPVFLDQFLLPLRGFLRPLDLLLEDDLDRALGPHDGEFRRGPSEIEVPADVFRAHDVVGSAVGLSRDDRDLDRKSTRLNSSHSQISYAVFCLKKKTKAQVSSTWHIKYHLNVSLITSHTLKSFHNLILKECNITFTTCSSCLTHDVSPLIVSIV